MQVIECTKFEQTIVGCQDIQLQNKKGNNICLNNNMLNKTNQSF